MRGIVLSVLVMMLVVSCEKNAAKQTADSPMAESPIEIEVLRTSFEAHDINDYTFVVLVAVTAKSALRLDTASLKLLNEEKEFNGPADKWYTTIKAFEPSYPETAAMTMGEVRNFKLEYKVSYPPHHTEDFMVVKHRLGLAEWDAETFNTAQNVCCGQDAIDEGRKPYPIRAQIDFDFTMAGHDEQPEGSWTLSAEDQLTVADAFAQGHGGQYIGRRVVLTTRYQRSLEPMAASTQHLFGLSIRHPTKGNHVSFVGRYPIGGASLKINQARPVELEGIISGQVDVLSERYNEGGPGRSETGWVTVAVIDISSANPQ